MAMTCEEAAAEFGRTHRRNKWQLAALVAAYAYKAKAGKVSKANAQGKISATSFAATAGVSTPTVTRYLACWNGAADAGLVPHADTIEPGTDLTDVVAAHAHLDLFAYAPVKPKDTADKAIAAGDTTDDDVDAILGDGWQDEPVDDEPLTPITEDDPSETAWTVPAPSALANQDWTTPDPVAAARAIVEATAVLRRSLGISDLRPEDAVAVIQALKDAADECDALINVVEDMTADAQV